MAKKLIPMMPPMTEVYVRPMRGGMLPERTYTREENSEMHMRRTTVPPGGGGDKEASVKDGYTFNQPMRADLDTDCL